MNASDQLADIFTIRQLLLQRIIGGESTAFNRHLDGIAAEIEKKLAGKALTAFQGARLNKAISELAAIVELPKPNLESLASLEADFTIGAFAQLGITAALPPKGVLEQITNASLVQGATISEWYSTLQTQTRFELSRAVKLGVSLGETNAQIAKRIISNSEKGTEVFAKTRRDAMAITRTAVQTVSNEVRQSTYQENEDIISGVQWISTLDGRTSDICVARSGLVWELPDYKPKGHKVPWNGGPPAHWNCRSTTIPVLKSFEELGINAPELPAGTRASMDGQVAQNMTFDQFLRGKPDSFADEMLGKGRAQLWRDGKITLSQLLDQRGNPLSLAELAKLQSKTTAAKPQPAPEVVKFSPVNPNVSDDTIQIVSRKEATNRIMAGTALNATDSRYGPPEFKGTTLDQFGVVEYGTNMSEEALSLLYALVPELDAIADRFNIPRLRGYRKVSSSNANGDMGDGLMGLNYTAMNSYALRLKNGSLEKRYSKQLNEFEEFRSGLRVEFDEAMAIKERYFALKDAGNESWRDVYRKYSAAVDAYNAKIKQLEKMRKALAKYGDTKDFVAASWKPNSPEKRPWSVKEYYSTGIDRARSLLYHEFAHHLHQMHNKTVLRKIAKPPLELEIARIFSGLDKDAIPSQYGTSDPLEWFAESFSLYMMGKQDLMQKEAIELIERLLDGEIIN